MDNPFTRKHAARITGTLSCFDRVLFKGYLPIASAPGLQALPGRHGRLLKDFKTFVLPQAQRLKDHAHALCRRWGRPYRHLSRPAGFPLSAASVGW
jgi:hypothetical protein